MFFASLSVQHGVRRPTVARSPLNGFGTSGLAPRPLRRCEPASFGALSFALSFSAFAACALSHFLRADPPGRVLFVSLLLFMFLLSSCMFCVAFGRSRWNADQSRSGGCVTIHYRRPKDINMSLSCRDMMEEGQASPAALQPAPSNAEGELVGKGGDRSR